MITITTLKLQKIFLCSILWILMIRVLENLQSTSTSKSAHLQFLKLQFSGPIETIKVYHQVPRNIKQYWKPMILIIRKNRTPLIALPIRAITSIRTVGCLLRLKEKRNSDALSFSLPADYHTTQVVGSNCMKQLLMVRIVMILLNFFRVEMPKKGLIT